MEVLALVSDRSYPNSLDREPGGVHVHALALREEEQQELKERDLASLDVHAALECLNCQDEINDLIKSASSV
jgi:hypothetical protein